MKRRLFVLTAGVLTICACSKSKTGPNVAPVSIVATDSGYIAPDTLHEGLNHIVFENRGSTIHECMFIRLPEGMSATQYLDAVRADYSFPEGAIDCSGPGLTSPLQRCEVWVSLDAGRYLLACWFNKHVTGIAPRTIVVHGTPRVPVTPPREDATLRMVDFRFELIGDIELGEQTIRVETVGPSMHEVDCFRLHGGRKLDEFRAWNTARPRNDAPPAIALGGVLDSHDISRVVWLKRDFTVGHYVLWCAMPMVQSGNEADAGAAANVTHADAGMILEFDVRM